MNWKKILLEADDSKLTFGEFVMQALIVGGLLIGGFYVAGVVI